MGSANSSMDFHIEPSVRERGFWCKTDTSFLFYICMASNCVFYCEKERKSRKGEKKDFLGILASEGIE